MINDAVREILEDFEKPETIKTIVGIEILKAFKKSKEEITKACEEPEDDEERRLAEYYRKVEKERNLLFIDYRSWRVIPYKIQEIINNQFEPFHCSGVCLNFLKVFPFLDNIFLPVFNTNVSAVLVKFFWHYQLTVTNGEESIWVKTKLSIKDQRLYNEHVKQNIKWVSGGNKSA